MNNTTIGNSNSLSIPEGITRKDNIFKNKNTNEFSNDVKAILQLSESITENTKMYGENVILTKKLTKHLHEDDKYKQSIDSFIKEYKKNKPLKKDKDKKDNFEQKTEVDEEKIKFIFRDELKKVFEDNLMELENKFIEMDKRYLREFGKDAFEKIYSDKPNTRLPKIYKDDDKKYNKIKTTNQDILESHNTSTYVEQENIKDDTNEEYFKNEILTKKFTQYLDGDEEYKQSIDTLTKEYKRNIKNDESSKNTNSLVKKLTEYLSEDEKIDLKYKQSIDSLTKEYEKNKFLAKGDEKIIERLDEIFEQEKENIKKDYDEEKDKLNEKLIEEKVKLMFRDEKGNIKDDFAREYLENATDELKKVFEDNLTELEDKLIEKDKNYLQEFGKDAFEKRFEDSDYNREIQDIVDVYNAKNLIESEYSNKQKKLNAGYAKSHNVEDVTEKYNEKIKNLRQEALELYGVNYENNEDFQREYLPLVQEFRDELENARKDDLKEYFESEHPILSDIAENVKEGFERNEDSIKSAILGPLTLFTKPIEDFFGSDLVKGAMGIAKKIIKKRRPREMDLVKLGEKGMPALWLGHTLKESIEEISTGENEIFDKKGKKGVDGDEGEGGILDSLKNLIMGGGSGRGTSKILNFLKNNGGKILKHGATAVSAIMMAKDGFDELERAEDLGTNKVNAFVSGALGGQFDESKGLEGALRENMLKGAFEGASIANELPLGGIEKAAAIALGATIGKGFHSIGGDNLSVNNEHSAKLIGHVFKSIFDKDTDFKDFKDTEVEYRKDVMMRSLESLLNTGRMSQEAYDDYIRLSEELSPEEFVLTYYETLPQELVLDDSQQALAGLRSIIPFSSFFEAEFRKTETMKRYANLFNDLTEEYEITDSMLNNALNKFDGVEINVDDNIRSFFTKVTQSYDTPAWNGRDLKPENMLEMLINAKDIAELYDFSEKEKEGISELLEQYGYKTTYDDNKDDDVTGKYFSVDETRKRMIDSGWYNEYEVEDDKTVKNYIFENYVRSDLSDFIDKYEQGYKYQIYPSWWIEEGYVTKNKDGKLEPTPTYKVNDAIIKSNGEIIETSIDDNIIATKNDPQEINMNNNSNGISIDVKDLVSKLNEITNLLRKIEEKPTSSSNRNTLENIVRGYY